MKEARAREANAKDQIVERKGTQHRQKGAGGIGRNANSCQKVQSSYRLPYRPVQRMFHKVRQLHVSQ